MNSFPTFAGIIHFLVNISPLKSLIKCNLSSSSASNRKAEMFQSETNTSSASSSASSSAYSYTDPSSMKLLIRKMIRYHRHFNGNQSHSSFRKNPRASTKNPSTNQLKWTNRLNKEGNPIQSNSWFQMTCFVFFSGILLKPLIQIRRHCSCHVIHSITCQKRRLTTPERHRVGTADLDIATTKLCTQWSFIQDDLFFDISNAEIYVFEKLFKKCVVFSKILNMNFAKNAASIMFHISSIKLLLL